MSNATAKHPAIYQLTTVHAITDNRILNLMAETASDAGYNSAVVGPWEKNFPFKDVQMIAHPVTNNRKSKWIRLTAPWRLFWFALCNKKCSIFAIHDPDMVKIGFLLKLFGKHIVYDIHDDYEASFKTRFARFGKLFSFIISKLWWYYEKALSHFFDGITVADQHLANKFCWGNPTILGNAPPLNFTKIANTEKEKTFNIIYVGSVTKVRGVEVILQAVRLLKYDDIRVIVIGNCSDNDILTQMDSDDRVCFKGRVAWENLHKYYQKSHIGIALYQNIPAFVYYTGENAVKIQEYIAAGIAVITSNFPGLTAFVKETKVGFNVQPDDPQAVADHIEKLYNNRDLLKQFAENGRNSFEKTYNWELHKHKLIDLYKKIVPID